MMGPDWPIAEPIVVDRSIFLIFSFSPSPCVCVCVCVCVCMCVYVCVIISSISLFLALSIDCDSHLPFVLISVYLIVDGHSGVPM